MKLTIEEIERQKTAQGGWTRKTLEGWGVSWPPANGWKKALLEGTTPPSSEARKRPSANLRKKHQKQKRIETAKRRKALGQQKAEVHAALVGFWANEMTPRADRLIAWADVKVTKRVKTSTVRGKNLWGIVSRVRPIMACWCCEVEKPDHMHHIVQVQHGGLNLPCNLVPLCDYCHAIVHPWMRQGQAVMLVDVEARYDGPPLWATAEPPRPARRTRKSRELSLREQQRQFAASGPRLNRGRKAPEQGDRAVGPQA